MEISRRNFMILGASAATLAALPLAGASAAGAAELVSPAEALSRLKAGNTRSANGNLVAKNYSPLGSTPRRDKSRSQPSCRVVIRGWFQTTSSIPRRVISS